MALTISSNAFKRSISDAVNAAEIGAKRAAACSAVQTGIGSAYSIAVIRSGVDYGVFTMTGNLPIVGTSIVITNAAIGSLVQTNAIDLSTGTWTAEIRSATNAGYKIGGSLGTSGTDFTLAQSTAAANSLTIGTIALSFPASLDQTDYLDVVAINCGGGTYTAVGGRTYLADTHYVVTAGGTSSTTDPISGTVDDPIFQTERWGEFTYQIPVTNSTYRVALQLAEFYAPINSAGLRVFTVKFQPGTANEVTVSNIDIYAAAGFAAQYTVTRDITVTNNALTIQFIAQTQSPKCDGIVVTSNAGGTYVVPPPPPVVSDDFLLNNVTLSTVASPLQTGEREVLFAGAKTVRPQFFWVTPVEYPFSNANMPPPSGLFGGAQWHGGWRESSPALGMSNPELVTSEPNNTNPLIYKPGPASMLQFMIKNYSKTSGWTDADYYWDEFEQRHEAYKALNAKVSFYITCNVTEIFGGGTKNHVYHYMPEISLARWKDALQRVVARDVARGRVIAHYEMLNEPDALWNPYAGNLPWKSWANDSDGLHTSTVGISPKYAQLTRLASQIIKAVDPQAKISAAHSAGVTGNGEFVKNFFINNDPTGGPDAGYGTGTPGQKLYDYVDIWGHHGYSNANGSLYRVDPNTGEVFSVVRDYQSLRDAWQSLPQMASKPLLITEQMGNRPGGFTDRPGLDNEADRWQWFNCMALSIACGFHAHVHFTYGTAEIWGNPSLSGVATLRQWRDDLVTWLTTGQIVRIAWMNTAENRIRITKADGTWRETGGNPIAP